GWRSSAEGFVMRFATIRPLAAAALLAVAGAGLTACAGSGPSWNEGPGWRLSGSPTTIPPPKPATPAAALALAPPPAPHAAPARKAGQSVAIVVQPGDSLTGLAIRHRTSISAIMAANRMSDPRIVPGQQLIIPGK
ncbi:MAG TPA: LysM peptidoglycan-binding domain-containing protein, partial [Hyphomicrobiaceae bacterium]|nr:LysM peptidoglycan-binding domain-containing protein [Hyphomicrobiaceae bacterium]